MPTRSRSDSRAEMGGHREWPGTGAGGCSRQREQHVHRPCGCSRGRRGGWHGGWGAETGTLGHGEGFLFTPLGRQPGRLPSREADDPMCFFRRWLCCWWGTTGRGRGQQFCVHWSHWKRREGSRGVVHKSNSDGHRVHHCDAACSGTSWKWEHSRHVVAQRGDSGHRSDLGRELDSVHVGPGLGRWGITRCKHLSAPTSRHVSRSEEG